MANVLPTLVSVLLRFACLYLFFWYLLDFIFELWSECLPFAVLVGLVALLALGTLIWKLINSWDKFDLDKNPPSGGLFPFLLLDLIPIIAVAIASWISKYEFCCGLLRFTQGALRRAREEGWPTRSLDAGHFHMLVDPAEVVDEILALLGQLAVPA